LANHIGEFILGILGTAFFTLLWKRLDTLDRDIRDVRSELHRAVATLEKDIQDLRNQITHFVDVHLNHEGRISTVEERTKKL
jgi:septal ring factor EnvC (AmiA/AmiB activator)